MITPYRYSLSTSNEELSNLSQVDVAYHIYKHPESINYIDKYVNFEYPRQRNHPICLYTKEVVMKPDELIGNYQTIKVMYGDFPLDNFDISVISKMNNSEFNYPVLPYQYRLGSTLNNEKGEEIQNLSQVNVAEYIKKYPEHIYYISKYVDQGYLRSVQFGLYYREIEMNPDDIIGNYQSMKDIYGYYPFDNFDISVIRMFNKPQLHAIDRVLNSSKKCIIFQSADDSVLDKIRNKLIENYKEEISADSGLLFFTNSFSKWIDRYEYLHQLTKTKKYLLFQYGRDFDITNIGSYYVFFREMLSKENLYYRQIFKESVSFNTNSMKIILLVNKISDKILRLQDCEIVRV